MLKRVLKNSLNLRHSYIMQIISLLLTRIIMPIRVLITLLQYTYILNEYFIILGSALDDLSLDPFESKSRKSSGFSSSGDASGSGGSGGAASAAANGKSRQYSGYDLDNKSRNCSGNSISAGFVNSGILNNGTAPVMIPGSTNMSPKGGSPLQSTLTNGIINENNTGDNVSYKNFKPL